MSPVIRNTLIITRQIMILIDRDHKNSWLFVARYHDCKRFLKYKVLAGCIQYTMLTPVPGCSIHVYPGMHTLGTVASPSSTRGTFIRKRPKYNSSKRTPPLNCTSHKGLHGKSNVPPPKLRIYPSPPNCKTLQRTRGTKEEVHGDREPGSLGYYQGTPGTEWWTYLLCKPF
eukprot:2997599-Rhodomonas_salina.1